MALEQSFLGEYYTVFAEQEVRFGTLLWSVQCRVRWWECVSPSIAQLVERWTVVAVDIHRSLVRIRLEGFFT